MTVSLSRKSRVAAGALSALALLGLSPLGGGALFAKTGSSAQSASPIGTSREVVQPLPSPDVQRLNRALMELARRPERLDSLLKAADASLAVGDFDAAIGFYGRAADIAPGDPRVRLGTARVYLQTGRPVEALPRFAAAQAAGVPARDLLADRALALDMVGDQVAAQKAYRRALELDPANDEARRRLAVSQAISGDVDAFRETLAPLLETRDFAAFRMRAFGLAILGDNEQAAAIVDAVMPADLAARIVPYLAFMPRLTPAQQAAAANLGIFPPASDIGRDEPRIARFDDENAATSSLEPRGEPLGPRVQTESREVAQQIDQPTTQPTAQSTVQAARRDTASAANALPDVTVAFADLDAQGDAAATVAPPADAVDLSSIAIPRERAASEQPSQQPALPQYPERIWVQVATGRDVDALAFDWRRFSRRVPDLLSSFQPHTVPWGQANRLLAGPLDSDAAARELVNALAANGLDAFPYTSPEGTQIEAID